VVLRVRAWCWAWLWTSESWCLGIQARNLAAKDKNGSS